MFKTPQERPTKQRLRVEAAIASGKTGRKIEKIAILPGYLRDFEFDIHLIANPKRQESKALDRALLLEKARVYLEFMPELIDKEELAVQIAEAYGDKPEKILKRGILQPQTQEEGQFPGAGNLGVSENMGRSLIGNAGEGMNIRNLAQGITQ